MVALSALLPLRVARTIHLVTVIIHSLRKKGIMKTMQASRKKMLPHIAQKFPTLAMMKAFAERTNKSQPAKSI
ncbi:MAG: hypothetical protein WBO55_08880 [Rhizobiaceae bacterium]